MYLWEVKLWHGQRNVLTQVIVFAELCAAVSVLKTTEIVFGLVVCKL